jgi:hypothetical protein
MRKTYKPGEVVGHSGVYKIYHDSHRLMHEATLLSGTRFPRCRQCGERVRFTLIKAVQKAHFILPFRSTHILEAYDESEEPFAAGR